MIKGFTILREEELPDFNGYGILLKHDRTGMKIFYFRPEKNNQNYFSYNFKTPVTDDSGIAHALEHMVLQGSKKYPLKNMFFNLQKKTFATKMNAATGQRKTYFYAESYIPEDYFRLLEIFGDAVFFPLLDERSFKQEVWRFDLNEKKEPQINGVVFNEMSSLKKVSEYSKKKFIEQRLFQNSEDGFNSGGDFFEIPDLTRDKLLKFHKKYYTPSNCLLFLFGKIDLEEQMIFLEEKLLRNLPENTNETFIKDDIIPLPSLSEYKIEVPHKGIDDLKVSLNILCKDEDRGQNIERNFFFHRIGALLEKQLQFCNIGKVFCSYSGSPKHKYFSINMNSVKKENVEKAKALILNSLEHCLDQGFDYEELKAACKEKDLEFENIKSLTQIKPLEINLTNGWVESDDPFIKIYGLKDEWEELKNKMLFYKDEDFKYMLNKYLVLNQNKSFFIQVPDQKYFEKIEEKRTALLMSKFSESGKNLSEIEKEKFEFENFLKQDDSELVEKLFPPLEIKEIKDFDDAGIADIEMVDGKHGPIHLFSCAQETDEKVYVSIRFALDSLSKKEFQQLSWFTNFLNNFGFSGMKEKEVESLFMEKGLKINQVYPIGWKGSENGGKEIYENRYWMNLKFNCYKKDLDECLEIFRKYIYEKNFNDSDERKYAGERLIELYKNIQYEKAELFAIKKVKAYFSKVNAFDNENNGINKLNIQKENLLVDRETIICNYISIYEKIINGSAVVNVFCNEQNLKDAKESVKAFIKRIEIKPLEKERCEYLDEKFPETEKEVSTILTPVSSGMVVVKFPGSKYPSKEFAIESAFLTWFNKQILFEELRKLNGAYGCFCLISETDNLIQISTTRDPSPDKSLKVIEECLEKMKDLENDKKITDELVKEAVLKEYAKALKELNPVIKGEQSIRRRLKGLYPEMRRTRLESLLEVTREDFIKAGKRIYENSKNLKACIVTGDERQVCGEVVCDLRSLNA